MKTLCEKSCKFVSNPCAVLGFVTLISMIALGAALASQIFGGLEPCILCIYQRMPYMGVIFLGLLGLALKHNERLLRLIMGLCGLAFLVNASIALYHTGVEQKWWKSFVQGCAVKFEEGKSVLESIMGSHAAPCDEIAWADPVFGLSMANYNVLLCLGLFAVCALASLKQCPVRPEFPGSRE